MTPEEVQQAKARAEELKQNIRRQKERLLDTDLSEWSHQQGIAPARGRDLRVRRTLKGHDGKIYAMRWSYDSRHVLSAAQDGKMILWEAPTTNKLAAVNLSSSWVMCCDLSQDRSLAASGGLDNVCTIHRLSTGEKVVELNGHTGFLSGCRFLPSNQMLTVSGDARAIQWDAERGVPVREFIGHSGDIACMDVCDAHVFATGGCDFNVRVWDVRTGRTERMFTGNEADVNALAFFPDGNALATGSENGCVRLYDLRADNEIAMYVHDDMVSLVTSLSFSPSGQFLFVGYDDSNYCQWDVLRAERTLIVAAHDQRISSLGVAPDGTALCTASWDGVLKIWS